MSKAEKWRALAWYFKGKTVAEVMKTLSVFNEKQKRIFINLVTDEYIEFGGK